MSLSAIRQDLFLNIKNIPGNKYNRKFLLIECDDWGGIRMPSKKVYDYLISNRIPFPEDHFDKLDTLEDKPDLDALFEILLEIKDSAGNHAVMTPFVNVANPDFEKIQLSDFQEYFIEAYPQTLLRYERNPTILSAWQQGIGMNIFVPEFHGREHLCVPLWLNELQRGHKDVLKAFQLGYTTVLVEGLHPVVKGFRPQFFFDDENQKTFLSASIKNGVALFKDIFGYSPLVLVPSNGVFHPDFVQDIISSGIKFLNVNHMVPTPDGKGGITMSRFYYTRKRADGLTYYMRNCAFEPSGGTYSGIGLTLKQIEASFRWNKPAIVSTHRVNFVGGISKQNRDHGISELKALLREVMKRWPDVRFISTRDLINISEKGDYDNSR